MKQRDWYLKEVQKFAALLARLMGLKNDGRQQEAFSLVESSCRDLTGLTAFQLTQLHDEALIGLLQERELKAEQIEALAELLAQEGEIFEVNGQAQEAISRLKKAIFLLNYVTESRKEFSFEREQRLNALRTQLQNVHSRQN